MILLIDNYDSFVDNLARYLRQLGAPTTVVRNDALTAEEVPQWAPQAIVISPGPCGPDQAGCSSDIVRRWQGTIPILGICLGHQVIVHALGGQVIRSPRPMHGVAGRVWHCGDGVFEGVPNPFRAGRYHSLITERSTLPTGLRVTAWLDDGTVMGVADDSESLVGMQFHPESMLTDCGYDLLRNFLQMHGISRGPESQSLRLFTTPRRPAPWHSDPAQEVSSR